MKYTKYPELKAELKELAKEIKKLKYKRDHWQEFADGQPQWRVQGAFMWKAARKAWLFRHRHIAYCQLNGTPYYMIECPANDNKPDKTLVRQIMEKYKGEEHVFYRNNQKISND